MYLKCREGLLAAGVGRATNRSSSFSLDSLDERTIVQYSKLCSSRRWEGQAGLKARPDLALW
ncbi:hypothetical protein E2C01_059187 [Portunus trituberculatus]|uniref:Uncharacterized protein n=1 Tax=Portunus trituberculatus TaxID=210409 RepID=A0A5B7H4P3_PORTR|nr:hypothetical protein [Portunus trituberculatus]